MASSLATGLAIERTSQNATPMPMVSATSRQAIRIVTDRDDAAATEIDRHARHRPHRLPVQHEALAQALIDARLRVQQLADEPAVRARQLLVEPAEQAQRQDRSPRAPSLGDRGVEIGEPVQQRRVGVLLRAQRVELAARRRSVRGEPGIESGGPKRAIARHAHKLRRAR